MGEWPMMKVYVSGPISGYEEANLPAFRLAADFIALSGHKAVVPHDIWAWDHGDTKCPKAYTEGPEHSAACYLRGDLLELLQCDAIYMIGGWQASVGAMLEHQVAAFTGLAMYYWDSAIPLPPPKVSRG